jgi:YaaC-like Protein
VPFAHHVFTPWNQVLTASSEAQYQVIHQRNARPDVGINKVIPLRTVLMAIADMKYGFPLFTRASNTVYLGNHKKLIISDIWSFWDYVIKKHKTDRDFLNALLEQAKHFYSAAESSPLKSKPLLYYYSFLNLSKILICIEKGYGASASYMHGLSEKHNGSFAASEIKVKSLLPTPKNVGIELLHVLDASPPPGPITLKVKDLMAHCIGVHRAYSETYKKPESFFRLENLSLEKNKRNLKFSANVKCVASDLPNLIARGYAISAVGSNFTYTCDIATVATHTSRADYFALSQKIRREGVWHYIGNNGYTYYLSNNALNRYEPESIIYLTMFYLGSITRYHPYMFDKLFSDKEQWLMSEFLTTQPKQFIYLATAKVLGQHVLKAYASF